MREYRIIHQNGWFLIQRKILFYWFFVAHQMKFGSMQLAEQYIKDGCKFKKQFPYTVVKYITIGIQK
jgi:hypothetical protein